MMKPKGIYIFTPQFFEKVYGPDTRRELQTLVDLPDRVYSAEEVRRHPKLVRDVELIFSSWGGPLLDEAFLTSASHLKAFFYGAGTVKGIVTDAFWSRDIPITTAASANAVPVAEFAHAQILLSLKRVWWYTQEIQCRGGWPDSVSNVADLAGAYGSTVGIFSLGMIGRMVCEKLKANKVNVIAYDPFFPPERASELGVELVAIEDLFRHSDVVSLHAPWLKETEDIVSKRLLRLMKKNATLINTARGRLINEAGLIETLQERPDLFALLDVTAKEPPENGSPLYALPNVVLTPHIAGSVANECRRMGLLMLEELKRFLDGKPLRFQVTHKVARISA
jgi:phosphoglycerate dehydrogenase-like enzyme